MTIQLRIESSYPAEQLEKMLFTIVFLLRDESLTHHFRSKKVLWGKYFNKDLQDLCHINFFKNSILNSFYQALDDWVLFNEIVNHQFNLKIIHIMMIRN